MAEFILETNYPSRLIIRQTKTNFDEYFVYIYVTRSACYTTGVLVLIRVEAWREIQKNMAAVVALLTDKWQRRALDLAL